MHLVESFSLNTGLKISKPYLYEKFVPLPFQNDYITLQPYGKFESRKYDYWAEVIDILGPILDEKNIKIVQLGVPPEKPLYGCYDMIGKTEFNQAAYLIKNSILHVGIDSFGMHFGSGYNKKMVGLYSNMLPSQSGPFWSKDEDVIILEPDRPDGFRASYAPQEDPKTINTISPIDVVKSICSLINMEIDFPYKVLRIGKEYANRRVEVVPLKHVMNVEALGVDAMIVRMDEYFNEEALVQQLRICSCSIVTTKPININILKKFRGKINEFVFFVDETTEPNYFEIVKRLGIPFHLMTYLNDEELNKIKLDYVDVAPIVQEKKAKLENIKELEGKDLSKIFYKSSCLSVLKENLYSSSVFAENNKPVTKIRNLEPEPVIDDPDFWDGAEHYLLLEKTS